MLVAQRAHAVFLLAVVGRWAQPAGAWAVDVSISADRTTVALVDGPNTTFWAIGNGPVAGALPDAATGQIARTVRWPGPDPQWHVFATESGAQLIWFSPANPTYPSLVFASTSEGRGGVWSNRTGALVRDLGEAKRGHWSADGARLVTVGPVTTVWSWPAGEALHTLAQRDEHQVELDGSIPPVVDHWAGFTPDRRRIVTASAGASPAATGWIAVWDADSGRLIRRWAAPIGPTALSVDGTELAVWSTGSIGRWDVASSAPLGHIALDPRTRPGLIQYSPDGTRLLLNTGHVYELEHGALRTQMPRWATSRPWLANGAVLVRADDRIGVADPGTGAVRRWLQGPGQRLTHAQFSADSTRLAAVHGDALMLLDLVSGVVRHQDAGGLRTMAWAGEVIFALDWHGRLWRMSSDSRPPRAIPGPDVLHHTLVASPDGTRIVAWGPDRASPSYGITAWEVATGAVLGTVHRPAVSGVVVSPRGGGVGINHTTFSVWSPGAELPTWQAHAASPKAAPRLLWFPDERRALSVSGRSDVYVHDLEARSRRLVAQSRVDRVGGLSRGRMAWMSGGAVVIRDMSTWERHEVFTMDRPRLATTRVSRDGTLVAALFPAGVELWDVATTSMRHRVRLPWSAEWIELSPNGRWCVAGRAGGNLAIIDTHTGRVRVRFVALEGKDWAVLDDDRNFDVSRREIRNHRAVAWPDGAQHRRGLLALVQP